MRNSRGTLRRALAPVVTGLASWVAQPAGAQVAPPATAAPGDSPALNPAISVIGWLQASAGDDPRLPEAAGELKEVELALQKSVDPYFRADFFFAASPEGFEIEEAYLTWLSLPAGLNPRLGKLRSRFGRLNPVHLPETPFADRPLAAERAWGPEGLAAVGVSLLMPVAGGDRWAWELAGEAGVPPDAEAGDEGVAEPAGLVARGARDDLLYLVRSGLYVDLDEATSFEIGVSGATAPAGADLALSGRRVQAAGYDLTLRWRNPRRALYREFRLAGEGVAAWSSGAGERLGRGAWLHAEYRFARRTSAGLRWDWTDLTPGGAVERAVLALVTFRPSEFSAFSVQGRRLWEEGDAVSHAIFLKTTFSIGSHGAHPL